MKTKLLSLAVACTLSAFAFSQSQRLVLVEHFTQASCGPCASQNPALETTLNANPTKVVAIKHQVSWPGTDPMNAHYPAGPGDRRNYYGISSVPNTVLDGNVGGPGAPNSVVTQASIDNRYAVSSPFDIGLTFTKVGSVLTANMNITCTQNVTGNLVAHIAVVEKHISFGSPPGSNGETDFHNVLKQYLPNTSGTSLSGSWTVGQTQSITESWAWTNVYDENELAVIAFIQDVTTKEVHQAQFASTASVPASDDAGIMNATNAGNLCNTTYTPTVTLANYGSNTLTSATINYNVNGGPNQTYNWTGSLAAGASTTVSLNAMTVNSGINTFNAYTTNPNGTTDGNSGNDAHSTSLSVGNSTINLALITDCWGSETSWEIRDASSNVWASGGGYPNVTGGATYNHNACLVDGNCYDFVINDAYGDGMYGSQYGSCSVNGTYTITETGGGTTLATMQAANSDFGNQEINNFCVPPNVTVAASFSGSQTNLCQGTSVSYTDQSTGSPTTWSWSFPGGTPSTSTSQSPTVVYNTPGTYSVTLTVNNGGSTDTEVLNNYITVNPNPTGTTSTTDAACGQSNGSATVTPAGGSAPYTYSWTPGGSTTATASNLAAGAYTVTIADANGCTATAVANVSNAGGPTVTESSSNATCAQNDGSITVNVSGGQSPYTYSWTPNVSTTNSASGLAPGNYSVVVTDANNCSEVVSVTITAPAVPGVTSTGTNEICAGDCDGTLDATPSGGTAPYSYSWDNGLGAGASQSNVCPGTYTVTITDANGCTSTDSYTVAAGAAVPVAGFTPSSTQTNVGSPITFTNSSTNGTTYSWDFGDGNSSADSDPIHTYTSAGTYTVTLTVTNSAGCTDVTTVTVTITDGGVGVEQIVQTFAIDVFPNPSTGVVNIHLNDVTAEKVQVRTPLGQLVATQSIDGNEAQMDLSHLSTGIYFVTVHAGDKKSTARIMIRK